MTFGRGRCWAAGAALVATAITLTGDPTRAAQPSPHTSLGLAGGAFLHLYALPLGFTPSAIVGEPSFDASGTRAVFVGAFPGAAVFGDPLRMDPAQAFLLDVSRRRLTQLTLDGRVRSVRWTATDSIDVRDGDEDDAFLVAPAQLTSNPTFRFSADQSVRGDLAVVSPETSDRLTVYRRSDGRYVVREIGARRLRVDGVSPGGRFALLGENLAWVDSRAGGSESFERVGASNSVAPRFGDAYGRQLTYINPLSSSVYQGAYRDGVAYFAFSHGLTRIVAATRDFATYFYPPMPDDPAYSVGDGLGALDDGGLYLAWPENLQLTVRRGGRFVTLPMSFPPGYSDPKPLIAALGPAARSGEPALWPALQPDADALDAALIQWRVYPARRGSSPTWIASHLGRVYFGDARAKFVAAQPPVFPFAVLARADDGTLWGASPSRASTGSNSNTGTKASIARPTATSTLWSSLDGVHWRVRYAVDGSPGAVGADSSGLWVALTEAGYESSMICVARLAGDANPRSYPTGGSYDGEQLFFASLSSGFYLVWGATPGRSPADQGALSAYRLDAQGLFAIDGSANNVYTRIRNGDSAGATPADGLGDSAMLDETVRELERYSGYRRPVLATNIAGTQAIANAISVRSPAAENAWEAEFGARPSPLGIVIASPAGDGLTVARSVWFAPLHGHGATEIWRRDADRTWRLTKTIPTWSL